MAYPRRDRDGWAAVGAVAARRACGRGVADVRRSRASFLEARDSMGVAPSQALLVGDSPWDAYAAGRAGIGMFGVRTGGFSQEALRHAGAIDVVPIPAI
ncbi:MAG: HAD family hydrolase [Egibacteraceae bacterium]